MNLKPLVAELVGTFTLVFIGAGAGALATGGAGGIALAHGLVLAALIYAYGDISGMHVNPAVTLGVVAAGRMGIQDAVGYWIAQFAGGILGAAGVMLAVANLTAAQHAGGLGGAVLMTGLPVRQGVLIEAVLTFLLVSAVLHCAVSGKAGKLAGVAIGFTLAACILMGGPLTGATLNPARALGPALFDGSIGNYWIFLLGQLLGAAVAAGLWRYLRSDDEMVIVAEEVIVVG